MTKKYKLSADKLITDKMFWFLVKNLIPRVDYNEAHVLTADDGSTATVGTILDHTMVPRESDPTKLRREYKYLRSLNQVDAGTLIDYLRTCPNKGSNNGSISSTPTVVGNGFGGAAS